MKLGKKVATFVTVLLCLAALNKWCALETHLRLQDCTIIKRLCVSDLVLFEYEKSTWVTTYLVDDLYDSDRVLFIDRLRIVSFPMGRSNRLYYLMDLKRLESDFILRSWESGGNGDDFDPEEVVDATKKLLQEIECRHDR